MHRQPLIRLLQAHARRLPEQAELAARFLGFVSAHPDCLLRSCRPGHITASAWIVDADGGRCLLTHHRKLGRWLQLGGHVDGEADVAAAALREAREESGMQAFAFPQGRDVALDLDVHAIPARPGEPEHLHWDVRFLLQAAAGQDLVVSAESHDLRWFGPDELAATVTEASVLRLHRRAQQCLPSR